MSEFLGSLWWLLVTLGILITFHEFGHFWVARRLGVRVLRFSVGFGKPLWSRTGRDGVEYAIGAIPLGGYVKFLDARESDDPERARTLPGEYSAAPVWHRIAIAAAGPLFNIAFTVFAFWAMFVIGRPDLPPVVGTPTGLAAQAGFAAGDRMTAVGGEPVASLGNAMLEIAQAAMRHDDVTVAVVDREGQVHDRVLRLSSLPGEVADGKALEAIGLVPQAPEATVGSVVAGLPAARGGVQAADRVLRINDTPIADWSELTHAIAAEAAKNPHLSLLVQRGNSKVPLEITAEREGGKADGKWMIGIGAPTRSVTALEQYGPLQAVPAALRETWKKTRDTLGMIGSMLSGKASTKNLSSVITIAQVANESAQQGLAWFLSFLAIISLSLGILNLLPIPILDGGHLLYYFIELVKGSPLSERALVAGQYVGLALLVTLMGLAFYNDIVRIVTS
jgi:regulator of sigma E protease